MGEVRTAREVIARALEPYGFGDMTPEEISEHNPVDVREFRRRCAYKAADFILAALTQAGLKCLPREPTPEMIAAAVNAEGPDDDWPWWMDRFLERNLPKMWPAMHDAADPPTPPRGEP